jgi:ribosomal-protein-alanine N-acetyltransferase
MKIKLRRFRPGDLGKVMEIEKSSFSNRKAWPKKYFENLHRKYPEGFIVAENESRIIGYTIGRPSKQSLRDARGQAKNGEAKIISLAVEPSWRGKGIGTKLTNFLINHLKKRGVKEIFLHVRTQNKTGVSFYQNLGFKILKTIKNYYRNGDNAYLMGKSI